MSNIEKIKSLVKDIQNLFLTKRYNLIIKESQKAIRQYPSLSIFYNLKGLALTQIGKFHEAKIILERGYKTNPDDLAIINNLANVNKNMFNFNEAKKLYNLSISKKKDYFNSNALAYHKSKSLWYYNPNILYKSLVNHCEVIDKILNNSDYDLHNDDNVRVFLLGMMEDLQLGMKSLGMFLVNEIDSTIKNV